MKRIILLFVGLCSAITLGAREITVDEALQIAKENNLNLKASQVKLESALHQESLAWNVFIPSVSLTAGYIHSNEAQSGSALVPVNGMETPMGTLYSDVMQYEYEASPHSLMGQLDFQLGLSPALVNGMASLSYNSKLSILEKASLWQETAYNIYKSFYQLLLLQKQISILQAQYSTMEQRYADMKTMYQSGFVTELDVLQVQVGLESMKPGLTRLESSMTNGLKALKLNLGLSQDEEIILKGEIPSSIEQQVEGDLNNSLSIQTLNINLKMLENGKNAIINQSLPRLVLGWNMNLHINDPFTNDNYSDFNNWRDQGSFSVMMNLPINNWLPFSSTQVEIQSMENQILALAYQKQITLEGLEVRYDSFISQLEFQLEAIESAEKSMSLAKRRFELTEEAYRAGTRNYLELKSSEDEYLSAQFECLSSQYDYLMNQLELAFLFGSF